jgi:hypothetical protein
MFHPDEPIGSRPVPAHILDACRPLVEERRDSTLAFIHISVKEYAIIPLLLPTFFLGPGTEDLNLLLTLNQLSTKR